MWRIVINKENNTNQREFGCDWVTERLFSYFQFDPKLCDQDYAAIDAHLAKCPVCAEAYKALNENYVNPRLLRPLVRHYIFINRSRLWFKLLETTFTIFQFSYYCAVYFNDQTEHDLGLRQGEKVL